MAALEMFHARIARADVKSGKSALPPPQNIFSPTVYLGGRVVPNLAPSINSSPKLVTGKEVKRDRHS